MNFETERAAIAECEIIEQWEAIVVAERARKALTKNDEVDSKLGVEHEMVTIKMEERQTRLWPGTEVVEQKLADASRRENELLEKLSIMEEASRNRIESMSEKLETADLEAVVVATKVPLPEPLAQSSSRTSKVIMRRICKRFQNGIFFGTVISYNLMTWRIRYDNGHLEDIHQGELERHLETVSMYRTRNRMRKYKR
jgi:hypothetical protein